VAYPRERFHELGTMLVAYGVSCDQPLDTSSDAGSVTRRIGRPSLQPPLSGDVTVRRGVLASTEERQNISDSSAFASSCPSCKPLRSPAPLNFLSAEALGAALLLDAAIAVTLEAPLLRSEATELAVSCSVIG